MGKIVKLCNSCDEGFAEKFVFCPNCGGGLEAFEMNRVDAPAEPVQEAAAEPAAPAFIEPEITHAQEAAPTEEFSSAWEANEIVDEPVLELGDEPVAEPMVAAAAPEPEPEAPKKAKKAAAAAAVTIPVAQAVYTQTTPLDVDRNPSSLDDNVFNVTVIEEKNGKTRNSLLAGAAVFMVMALLTGLVINIFSKDLEVGSINDDIFNAVIVEDVPTAVEEEVQKKNNDKGGGGGGGGREEKEEVTQGDLADQSKTPTRPPDAKVFRSDEFELKTPPPQTEGNQTFEKKFDRWGDPNGRFSNFSNGTGSGGGQGSGVGTGQGSGRGTGAGSGIGSGYGGGNGNGNGNGTGNGDGDSDPNNIPRVAGVTSALKILSKPRPGYTDEARQNNVQGTVILRVTFLSSGQVGGISAVKGLGNGLTEQAIAAAKRINFEPQKINGVPQSVTKQIEYTFSIY